MNHLTIFIPLILLLAFNTQAMVTLKENIKTAQLPPTTQLSSTSNLTVSWNKVGALPPPEGFSKSIGISAAYTEFLEGYLIIAGGANFPKGHPIFEQGKKEFYSDILVFDVSNNQFKLVARGHLPIKSAYGATVVIENSLYLIGGKNNEKELSSIIRLTLNGVTPQVEILAELPFSWSSGGVAWQNNALYLFAGQQNELVTNQVCKYSFETKKCLNPKGSLSIPGVKRVQFPYKNHNGNFYIFGGINGHGGKDNYVLTDAYAFNFAQELWNKLAPTTIDNEKFSVAGGGALALSDNQLLLLGGVDRSIFNNAVENLANLKGDRLKAFQQSYFNMSSQAFNFSRRQVVYNIAEDSWGALIDKFPFNGGAGPLNVTQKENKLYWISGEIKAVYRSPNVYQGILKIR